MSEKNPTARQMSANHPNPFRLELGKYYMSREGGIYGPLELTPMGHGATTYPYRAAGVNDPTKRTWREDGRFNAAGEEEPYDLVIELTGIPMDLVIGKSYRLANGDVTTPLSFTIAGGPHCAWRGKIRGSNKRHCWSIYGQHFGAGNFDIVAEALVIQAGKRYRLRSGLITGPIEQSVLENAPFRGVIANTNPALRYWKETGEHTHDRNLDIISEYQAGAGQVSPTNANGDSVAPGAMNLPGNPLLSQPIFQHNPSPAFFSQSAHHNSTIPSFNYAAAEANLAKQMAKQSGQQALNALMHMIGLPPGFFDGVPPAETPLTPSALNQALQALHAPKKPGIKPEAGLRYKLRNGWVTDPIRAVVANGISISIGGAYVFEAEVTAPDRVTSKLELTWTKDGFFCSHTGGLKEHPYDMVEVIVVQIDTRRRRIHFNQLPTKPNQ